MRELHEVGGLTQRPEQTPDQECLSGVHSCIAGDMEGHSCIAEDTEGHSCIAEAKLRHKSCQIVNSVRRTPHGSSVVGVETRCLCGRTERQILP